MTPEQRQEVFDRVCTHLLLQGARSMKGRLCAYRGEWDRMCAIGCLIDDEHYTPELEGSHVHESNVLVAVQSSLGVEIGGMSLDLLYELQKCHDNTAIVFWEDTLKAIARRFGLKYDA